MKSINRAIDRFCYKHPNFGVSNLMLYIVLGNAAVYLFTMMDRTNTFVYYLYFNPALILKGQVWRLFTFIFVPYSSEILWVAISLYFYYSLGNSLERFWGTAKFNLYYLGGIACTILYGVLYTLFSGGVNAYFFNFDATFINLSLFLAFAVINPDVYFLIFFFIPVKAKYLAIQKFQDLSRARQDNIFQTFHHQMKVGYRADWPFALGKLFHISLPHL